MKTSKVLKIFLGYEIGDQHTRHDLILAYFKYLSAVSERADLIIYGKSHEGKNTYSFKYLI